MKKVFVFLGFILVTILLELFYLNMQLVERINNIENTQKQYQFSIESINHVSDQTLNGIDQSLTSNVLLKK